MPLTQVLNAIKTTTSEWWRDQGEGHVVRRRGLEDKWRGIEKDKEGGRSEWRWRARSGRRKGKMEKGKGIGGEQRKLRIRSKTLRLSLRYFPNMRKFQNIWEWLCHRETLFIITGYVWGGEGSHLAYRHLAEEKPQCLPSCLLQCY